MPPGRRPETAGLGRERNVTEALDTVQASCYSASVNYRFGPVVFAMAVACSSDMTTVSLAPEPTAPPRAATATEPEAAEPEAAAPEAAAPEAAAAAYSDPVAADPVPTSTPEASPDTGKTASPAPASSRPTRAGAPKTPTTNDPPRGKAVDEAERATLYLTYTPDGQWPTTIPPGGSISGILKLPIAKPGEEEGDTENVETTLRHPDDASAISARLKTNYCYVDPEWVLVHATIPTLVKKGSVSHVATIIWSVMCKIGEERECKGGGLRPFGKEDDTMHMDIIGMTGARLAEKSDSRVVVKWRKNKLTVDAASGRITLNGASLEGGFSGAGIVSCIAEPPPHLLKPPPGQDSPAAP